MNLTETPEIITWPETHYVYLEKEGPFQETAPQAWSVLHSKVAGISEHNKIVGYMSLYRMYPTMLYRAGVAIDAEPKNLPEGLSYMKFKGGVYARFVLTGPFSDLPQACGRVCEIVEETRLPRREDYHMEHYVDDPRTTPEAELRTEILVPTF